jgi:hypothetical protein
MPPIHTSLHPNTHTTSPDRDTHPSSQRTTPSTPPSKATQPPNSAELASTRSPPLCTDSQLHRTAWHGMIWRGSMQASGRILGMQSMLPTNQPAQSSRICTATSRPAPIPAPEIAVGSAVTVAVAVPRLPSPPHALTNKRASQPRVRIASRHITSQAVTPRHVSTRLASPHHETNKKPKEMPLTTFIVHLISQSTPDRPLITICMQIQPRHCIALFASGSGKGNKGDWTIGGAGACHRWTVRCAVAGARRWCGDRVRTLAGARLAELS